jgi:UDP-N-acetylglucosamine--N-acetylmuramyl-(pentapeptide) pyrophosphoryl-undecaprenol N-acetylglucosamine transferase
MRLAIAGGGTGGHLMVGIALAQHLLRRDPAARVLFLCSARALDARLLGRYGFPFVPVAPPRSRLLPVLRGVAEAWRVLRRFRPHAVFALGGYAAVPGAAAARSLGVPVVLHEQNLVPGRANRRMAAAARARLCQWPLAPPWRCVGTPLRAEMTPMDPRDARRRFGLEPERPTLLVLGGSQGSGALNRIVPRTAPRNGLQVLHVGMNGTASDAYAGRGIRARVVPFCDDMAAAYSAADAVVTRAGALALWEICAFGVGAIAVPLPHARDGHQAANARFVARSGGAMVVEEARAEETLPALLRSVADDPGGWRARGERLRVLFRPGAADAILQELRNATR